MAHRILRVMVALVCLGVLADCAAMQSQAVLSQAPPDGCPGQQTVANQAPPDGLPCLERRSVFSTQTPLSHYCIRAHPRRHADDHRYARHRRAGPVEALRAFAGNQPVG
jgi:hypothetical protein